MIDPWWPLARWQGEHVLGQLPAAVVPVLDAQGLTDGGAAQRLVVTLVGDELAGSAGAGSSVFARTVAEGLADHSGCGVAWQSVWEAEARAREVHFGLLSRVPRGADSVVVLVVGRHDLLARTPVNDFRSELDATLALLAEVRQLVVCGVPELSKARLVRRPLAWSLGLRRRQLDAVAREVCANRGCAFVELAAEGPEDFAPGSLAATEDTYRRWAGEVAAALRRTGPGDGPPSPPAAG